MNNFFGTNKVVPNGYIYKTDKGSEYIFFEGIWLNHKTMKLIDPNKTKMMNEAATRRIIEHNRTNKKFIGESFTFTGKTYTYVGQGRYTEDGILTESIISEVIADEQRVYTVPRETLEKEWQTLGFYVLPPHTEDASIPAGLLVNGYRFNPKHKRFISDTDGSIADKVQTRELWNAATSLVNRLRNAPGSNMLPINSTIMMKDNTRASWNGTDFRDMDGNIVISSADAGNIKKKHLNFIQQNKADFPTLFAGRPTGVNEAAGDSEFSNFVKADPTKIEIPNKFKLDDFTYSKNKNIWYDHSGPVTEKSFNSELNADAVKLIQKYNSIDDYPVNSTVDYNGQTLTWNGHSWVSSEGKSYKSNKFTSKVDEFIDTQLNSDKKVPAHITEPQNPNNTTSTENGEVETQNTSGGTDQSSRTDSTSSSSSAIPDGYSITSRAGVKYIRKNGQWISSQTKKPMNSSAAMSIDRAAAAKIDAENKSSPIKVGEKWTSGKNKEYTYVGDGRFVSSNGKVIPKSSAEQILAKLSAEKGAQPPTNQSEPQDTQQPAGDSSSTPVVEPQTEPQSEPQSEPQNGEESGKPENAALESLAQKIKSHPLARKITVLLTRGDKVSLLAADLFLTGKEKDAINILKALNSSDE